MKCFWVVLFLMAVPCLAGPQATDSAASRFETVEIFVDAAGHPLAAYQLEFFAAAGDVRIAGIEGGAHRAFAEPPFYDPKAMQRERVILGAFSTDEAPDLPHDKIRVATIHLQVRGSRPPEFQIRLQTAADARGSAITAKATFEERNTP